MLSRIQLYRPKLHATLSCGSPVITCEGRVYRIARLSALEGRFHQAVLIEGILRDIVVVVHAETGSSLTDAYGWLAKRNDYVRASVPRYIIVSKSIVPALESLMRGITVKDLTDEMRSFRRSNVPLYDFNEKSDFHILLDVINRSEFTFPITTPRRYTEV